MQRENRAMHTAECHWPIICLSLVTVMDTMRKPVSVLIADNWMGKKKHGNQKNKLRGGKKNLTRPRKLAKFPHSIPKRSHSLPDLYNKGETANTFLSAERGLRNTVSQERGGATWWHKMSKNT